MIRSYRDCVWARESGIDNITICVGRKSGLQCICENSIIEGTCPEGIKETMGMMTR